MADDVTVTDLVRQVVAKFGEKLWYSTYTYTVLWRAVNTLIAVQPIASMCMVNAHALAVCQDDRVVKTAESPDCV